MLYNESFDDFKKRIVEESEQNGKERREFFGDLVTDHANARNFKMTEKEHNDAEAMYHNMKLALKMAYESGLPPSSDLAQKVCEMYKEIVFLFWGTFHPASFIAMAHDIANDPKAAEEYESLAPGCAAYFHDAVLIFCENYNMSDHEHLGESKYISEFRQAVKDHLEAKDLAMTEDDQNAIDEMKYQADVALMDAFVSGEPPSGKLAKKFFELHKTWFEHFFGLYSKGAHMFIAQKFATDPSYAEEYDEHLPGCSAYLCDVVTFFCKN